MTEPFVIVAAVAAGVAGLLYLAQQIRRGWRALRKVVRMVEAVHGLVEHELQPNSGGSLYDKVTRIDDWREQHTEESTAERNRLTAVINYLGLGL